MTSPRSDHEPTGDRVLSGYGLGRPFRSTISQQTNFTPVMTDGEIAAATIVLVTGGTFLVCLVIGGISVWKGKQGPVAATLRTLGTTLFAFAVGFWTLYLRN